MQYVWLQRYRPNQLNVGQNSRLSWVVQPKTGGMQGRRWQWSTEKVVVTLPLRPLNQNPTNQQLVATGTRVGAALPSWVDRSIEKRWHLAYSSSLRVCCCCTPSTWHFALSTHVLPSLYVHLVLHVPNLSKGLRASNLIACDDGLPSKSQIFEPPIHLPFPTNPLLMHESFITPRMSIEHSCSPFWGSSPLPLAHMLQVAGRRRENLWIYYTCWRSWILPLFLFFFPFSLLLLLLLFKR